MAGNSAIQILRTANLASSANRTQVLADGQPLYDKATGKLFIGDGSKQAASLTAITAGKVNEYTIYLNAANTVTVKAPNGLYFSPQASGYGGLTIQSRVNSEMLFSGSNVNFRISDLVINSSNGVNIISDNSSINMNSTSIIPLASSHYIKTQVGTTQYNAIDITSTSIVIGANGFTTSVKMCSSIGMCINAMNLDINGSAKVNINSSGVNIFATDVAIHLDNNAARFVFDSPVSAYATFSVQSGKIGACYANSLTLISNGALRYGSATSSVNPYGESGVLAHRPQASQSGTRSIYKGYGSALPTGGYRYWLKFASINTSVNIGSAGAVTNMPGGPYYYLDGEFRIEKYAINNAVRWSFTGVASNNLTSLSIINVASNPISNTFASTYGISILPTAGSVGFYTLSMQRIL